MEAIGEMKLLFFSIMMAAMISVSVAMPRNYEGRDCDPYAYCKYP